MKLYILLIILSIFCLGNSNAQTQHIRGKVTDKHSGLPLQSVAIYIFQNEMVGTETNENGNFILENVPIGRVSLVFSSIEKKPVVLNNLELIGSKELVLEVTMEDSFESLETIEIVSSSNKNRKTKNKHALVSARMVSAEEINKYAGSFNDVARMVMNYAGVKEVDDSKNDIVIRGNSSKGLLWRMNDVDIPNPNHFGTTGATGGPVNMINNNLLADSDFFMSAFTSDYSNAISGVFDLKMRKGNFYKQEFIGQVGMNGFELLAEGPIKKEKSSYLVSYRYSFLEILSKIGIDFGTGTAIPKYQDISFNTYFPIGKKGQLSFFGMGGKSNIHFDEDEESLYSDSEDITSESQSGFAAIQYRHQWSDNTFSKSTFSYSTIQSKDLAIDTEDKSENYKSDFSINAMEFSSYIKTKINKLSNLKAGIRLKKQKYDFQEFSIVSDVYAKVSDMNTDNSLFQSYISYYRNLNKKWTSVIGISSQYSDANKKATLEPRFSLAYSPNSKSRFNFGYGFHTQTPDLKYLAYYDYDTESYPNKDLDYIKTHHFVLGFDYVSNNKMRYKIETYYQYITNATISSGEVWIDEYPGYIEIYSSLNDSSFTNRESNLRTPLNLTDGGKGINYGLELTAERFLENGFYFLSTLSLFDSKYQAHDKKWRNTVFNGNYVFNILSGKEWLLKKNARLSIDIKAIYAGGLRRIPIDLESSIISDEIEYDFENAYEPRNQNYFRVDFRAGFKLDMKKTSHEWAFDIKNISNQKNIFGYDYNEDTKKIDKEYQLGIVPIFLYRIYF